MNLPYETLVLILASGGTIIIFSIAVAILCICRHVRRSRKAVIHILSTTPGAEETDTATDDLFWERNHLIPTASILHSFNPKAKIHAIRPSTKTPAQTSTGLPSCVSSELLPTKDDPENILTSADRKCLQEREELVSKTDSRSKGSELFLTLEQSHFNPPPTVLNLPIASREEGSEHVQNEPLIINHATAPPFSSHENPQKQISTNQLSNHTANASKDVSQPLVTNHATVQPFYVGSSYPNPQKQITTTEPCNQMPSSSKGPSQPLVTNRAPVQPFYTGSSCPNPQKQIQTNELCNQMPSSSKGPSQPLVTNHAPVQPFYIGSSYPNPQKQIPTTEPSNQMPSSSKDISQPDQLTCTASGRQDTVIRLHLQPCSSTKQCSTQNNHKPITESRSFCKPFSLEEAEEPVNHNLSRTQSFQDNTTISYLPSLPSSSRSTSNNLKEGDTANRVIQRAQSFQESSNLYLLSLPSSSNSVPYRVRERITTCQNTSSPSSSGASPSSHQIIARTRNHSPQRDQRPQGTNSQPNPSQRQRSKPDRQTTRSRHSFDAQSTSTTANSRPQRTQSFQDRVNSNLFSQRRQSDQGQHRSRREAARNWQEVRRTRQRTISRSRSMLSATQLRSERSRILDQPRTFVNRHTVCNSAEDVFVLDGSEPPPPYQS